VPPGAAYRAKDLKRIGGEIQHIESPEIQDFSPETIVSVTCKDDQVRRMSQSVCESKNGLPVPIGQLASTQYNECRASTERGRCIIHRSSGP
jgi:hypothetical protein